MTYVHNDVLTDRHYDPTQSLCGSVRHRIRSTYPKKRAGRSAMRIRNPCGVEYIFSTSNLEIKLDYENLLKPRVAALVKLDDRMGGSALTVHGMAGRQICTTY